MSTNYPNNLNNFIPEEYILPEDEEQFRVKLKEYFNEISSAINTKDSGLFDSDQIYTGQKFYPVFPTNVNLESDNSIQYRDVLRLVIDTGDLPSSTTKSVPHEIETTEDFTFVRIYGTATDPGTNTIDSAIPLPYINTTTPGDSVTLEIDDTNINITTTTANYTSYTRSYVILEWITSV